MRQKASRREMLAYHLGWVTRSAWRWLYTWAGLVVALGLLWLILEGIELIGRVI